MLTPPPPDPFHGISADSAPLPVAWHVARWSEDRFAGGSWSALRPGASPQVRAVLGEPIDGRFVIAADATNATQPSMVHGAWLEGIRAAEWAAAQQRGGAVDAPTGVVVIGGGFAGLGAAATLRRLGVPVVLVEARDRLGGRTHTVTLDSVAVDAGGAWLQQYERNPLARRAEQLSLRVVPTDFHAPLAAAADGPVPDVAAGIECLAAAFANAAEDAAVADVLPGLLAGLPPDQRRAVQFAIDLDLDLENGAPFTDLSARRVLEEPGVGNGDAWLPGGYRQLADDAAWGVDVRLGHEVRQVAWDVGGAVDGVVVEGVRADGSAFRLRAAHCICTIPVWLLPTLDLRPGLPARHRAALDQLAVCRVNKVVLQYATRWWPRHPAGNGYLRWYDTPVNWGEWLDLSDHVTRPTVAGLIAGDALDREHRGRSDADVAAAAAASFARWAAAVRGGRPG